jgi:hypothetical protein
MLEWYPYVPVGGEMAVNCAILSYNGTIYFGFSGDVQAAPDLKCMEKLLQTSFTELREAVNLRPPRTSRVKSQRRAVPAARVAAKAQPIPVVEAVVSESKRKPEPAPASVATEVVVA